MKLWGALYAMIWLVFVQIWLAYTPILGQVPYYLHIVLGFLILGLAYRNVEALRATTAPGRIKRTVQATFGLSILMAFLGMFMVTGFGASGPELLGITIAGVVTFIHFVNAMAIITQAAAAAIAYDMWEDREFLESSKPGEIPPAPAPGAPAKPAGA